MKVIVIGSGLIGITTAYFLRSRGHDVVVMDREAGPGRATSFANGGLLTPSMSDPWNAPGTWRVLLASLGRPDAAMQLRLRALPQLAGWGVTFLRNCRPELFERNVRNNLKLALYSLDAMRSLREATNIEYSRSALGTLRVFRERQALDRAYAVAANLTAEGLGYRKLSPAETVALEPALEPIASQLVGSIHYASDETGNAHEFCVALAELARAAGVQFRFQSEVSKLHLRSSSVTHISCGREQLVADRYIVAAGSYSTPLLADIGIDLPVRPAKGYSITFPETSGGLVLRIPVLDDELHAAVVPIGNRLRVAGTAEFAGYDLTLNPARIRHLLTLLPQVLPRVSVDLSTGIQWCGLRPVSADGVPIIGPTPVSNLMINSGHGPLGWTMAVGSAHLLTSILCGDTPAVDPAPFSLSRFAR